MIERKTSVEPKTCWEVMVAFLLLVGLGVVCSISRSDESLRWRLFWRRKSGSENMTNIVVRLIVK